MDNINSQFCSKIIYNVQQYKIVESYLFYFIFLFL